jgi:acetyltransferase
VQTLEIAAKNPNTDGFLLILAPQAMTDPTRTAELLSTHAKIDGKPILSSWMGGLDVATAKHILNISNIPNFSYPDEAVQAFNYMWKYDDNLRSLYETPTLPADTDEGAPDRTRAQKIIQTARGSDRTLLTEFESKELLNAYGIPTVRTYIASGESEAVKVANEIGYPVVLKLHSQTVTHKTDVGGIALNLSNDDTVRCAYRAIESSVREKMGEKHFLGVTVQPMVKLEGYEVIVGSSLDSQIGPVLLFGAGGQLVEVFKDQALALPPLNTTLARRLMEQTLIFTALKGVRGRKGIDLFSLELLLVRFSQLVAEQHWIKEIDINPLVVSPEQLIALDARVVLHGKDVKEDQLPQLAIRPYPVQYVQPWKMKDGTFITFRPIQPEDEPLMIKFHETLSEHTVYMRFFQALQLDQRIAHERLIRRCFIDYDREMALVADYKNPITGTHEILAVGRLSKLRDSNEAEFAVLIGDKYQNQGLGTELLRQLVQIGRDEKIHRITADILPENHSMQRVCEKLGFQIHRTIGDPIVRAEIKL